MTRRILLINSTGEISGAEIVLMRLARVAVESGHDVTLACPRGPLLDHLPAGVRHVAIDEPWEGRRGRMAGRALALRRAHPVGMALRRAASDRDAVVVNNYLALLAVSAARLDVPVAWLAHDVVVRRERLALLPVLLSGVDAVVAVSEAAAAPLRNRGKEVLAIPNGVQWPVDPRRAEPSHPVIGCAAVLTPWKGHRILLDAMAQVPDARLQLAGGVLPGDEAYAASLRERAAKADLSGRVDFLGRVDALDAMRGWTTLVSPSTEPEAMPLNVLEALSVGLPVVGTALGGTLEILGPAGGMLVPAGSSGALAAAILRMLGDTGLRRRAEFFGPLEVEHNYQLQVQTARQLNALLATERTR